MPRLDSLPAMFAVQALGGCAFYTILIHDGVDGQFFTLWDRIGGTYRAPDDA